MSDKSQQGIQGKLRVLTGRLPGAAAHVVPPRACFTADTGAVPGGPRTVAGGGAAMVQEAVLRLWDDNPSLVDLLGFDAVVDPIVTAIGADNVDPLAIGVHSPWGGGKSTVLNLLEDKLAEKPGYVVIRIDPWQYDNHADVRGDLIVEVLDQLAERFGTGQAVKNRITDLVQAAQLGADRPHPGQGRPDDAVGR